MGHILLFLLNWTTSKGQNVDIVLQVYSFSSELKVMEDHQTLKEAKQISGKREECGKGKDDS